VILIALLIFGVARGFIPPQHREAMAVYVLIVAIGLSDWVQYARTVRGATMVQKSREYVQAARLIGRSPFAIMLRHVLPNVTEPILVIATISLALAIIAEATLSFLGVGVPPTQPEPGHADPLRAGVPVLGGMVDPAVSLADAARAGAVGQPARGLAARGAEPAAAMSDPVLSVRDLVVEFPTRRGVLRALDGVSFDVGPGEILGVVGESGAGKSITGAAIIGLLEPPGRIAGGEIRLKGERIDDLPRERMDRVRGGGSAWCSRTR
jgi:hypothetical protein